MTQDTERRPRASDASVMKAAAETLIDGMIVDGFVDEAGRQAAAS